MHPKIHEIKTAADHKAGTIKLTSISDNRSMCIDFVTHYLMVSCIWDSGLRQFASKGSLEIPPAN